MTALRAAVLAVLLAFACGLGTAAAQVPPRLIKMVQVDSQGSPLGAGVELFCPPSGCQEPFTVTFEGTKETYTMAIDVVMRGIYISFTSRTLGTAAVMNFETGRPGPTFVLTRGRERIVTTLGFLVVRDESVRRERGFDAEKRSAEGAVFNRGRAPDLMFRVEILVPEA